MRFSSPSRPKSRVDSFGSDDSFDVVSMDGSEGECLEVEIDDGLSVDDEQDDGDADCEWEDVTETEPDESQVDINLDEGFQDAIEAALGSCISEATEPIVTPPLFSPRRSAREALRAFYLARAKSSEESSKNYRTYVRQPASPPAVIAPLRAPQRFDVELYERITREENQRKAKAALREFYAQRDAAKAVRAAENRANERFVYKSQIGSSHFLGMPHGVPLVEVETSSNFTQSPWETTRFVSAT